MSTILRIRMVGQRALKLFINYIWQEKVLDEGILIGWGEVAGPKTRIECEIHTRGNVPLIRRPTWPKYHGIGVRN